MYQGAWAGFNQGIDSAAKQDAIALNTLAQVGALQDRAMQRQQSIALRDLLSQTGGDPEKAMQLAIQSGNLQGAQQLAPVLEYQRKAREDIVQGDLRRQQAEELRRKAELAAQQEAARAKLQKLMEVGPADESGYQQTPFAGTEAELIRHMQTNPGRYRLVNPAEIRSLALEADPNAGVKSLVDLTAPKGIKDRITPVAGGYAEQGPDGMPRFVRTQPEPQPRNVQVVQTPQGPRVVEPGSNRTAPLLGDNNQPLPSQQTPNLKPLPSSALKMQQEELEMIQTAGGINADIGAMRKQIEDGKLKLGPVRNVVNQARNFVGMSDEQSQEFATLKATFEKLRNDSLRLNKGVQTEGDAVRAWNELLANLNDPQVVAKRLSEIERINDRAMKLRKMNIDAIRLNYGHDPLDVTPYINQPAAVGGPKQSGGYSDPEKERRYQEWKAKQGAK